MEKGVDCVGTCVVFACHDGHGNYLFSKRGPNCRDEQGTWDPGAGGIELHDTVIDTLKKEIAEEYCADVLDYEFMGYRDIHREQAGQKTHWIALDFRVLINREQARNGEPHKMDEVAWFKPDEVPLPTHSQWPDFLERYRERLI